MIEFKGGTGASLADAVEIHGVANHFAGVDAEYRYLSDQFGERGKDWDLLGQVLLEEHGKHYDQMEIVLADGTRKTIYFDLSAFFGRF